VAGRLAEVGGGAGEPAQAAQRRGRSRIGDQRGLVVDAGALGIAGSRSHSRPDSTRSAAAAAGRRWCRARARRSTAAPRRSSGLPSGVDLLGQVDVVKPGSGAPETRGAAAADDGAAGRHPDQRHRAALARAASGGTDVGS
jgi:hypothetical protein